MTNNLDKEFALGPASISIENGFEEISQETVDSTYLRCVELANQLSECKEAHQENLNKLIKLYEQETEKFSELVMTTGMRPSNSIHNNLPK